MRILWLRLPRNSRVRSFSASMNSPSTRVRTGEHLVSVFGVDFSAGDEVYIIEISGVAPDIFLRVAFFDLLQESGKLFLILRLEGFAA